MTDDSNRGVWPRAWVACAVAGLVVTQAWFGRISSVTAQTQPAPVGAPTADAIALQRERLSALPDAVGVGPRSGTAYMLDVVERVSDRFPERASGWLHRARRQIDVLEQGIDPYVQTVSEGPRFVHGPGQIMLRGYQSAASTVRQGYAVYLPPNYDPNRRYPVLVALHGGSSNGNLFLGVVLGNNMDWLTYSQHLWDEYRPQWSPDWIIVAPDGFGHVIWRWMGEEDVQAVISDVRRNYSVDDNRVVLCGLSNGGIGAYSMGMRHASDFSIVVAIAGAPSWLQYAGGRPSADENLAMLAWSGMHLVQNSVNTDFRFFHGRVDPGPMRPRFVEEMQAHMTREGLTPNVTWYDMGHDLLYVVHRRGRAYDGWATVTRNPSPRHVRLVTRDYRARSQHWLTVEHFARYPEEARLDADVTVEQGVATLAVHSTNVVSLSIDMARLNVAEQTIVVTVDDQEVLRADRTALGNRLYISREGGVETARFAPGRYRPRPVEKRPGMSGPLTDPYRERMVHVYGTGDPESTDRLRRTAQRGARGWPVWLWNVQHQVVSDTQVTDELRQSAHLVLYGTPGSNRELDAVASELPIRVEGSSIRVGPAVHSGRGLGTRFIYPNPRAPGRYLIIQTAPTLEGVEAGHNLPDFLSDYVVYDVRTTSRRERLIAARRGYLTSGYFDRFWQLAEMETAEGDDGPAEMEPLLPVQSDSAVDAERRRILGVGEDFRLPPLVLRQTPPITLPLSPVPETPARTRSFAAPASDPAGAAARRLAGQATRFLNFRGIVAGARWQNRPQDVWQVSRSAECLSALRAARVRFHPYPTDAVVEDPDVITRDVPTPIELTGDVAGVRYINGRPGPLIMSCELVRRLIRFGPVLTSLGINRAVVASSHRDRPLQSFHRFGLAVDISTFVGRDGTRFRVLNDFEETPADLTCSAAPRAAPAAETLRQIACAASDQGIFNTVLTPNYNDGHRDHFHFDIRPNDPRFYVR